MFWQLCPSKGVTCRISITRGSITESWWKVVAENPAGNYYNLVFAFFIPCLIKKNYFRQVFVDQKLVLPSEQTSFWMSVYLQYFYRRRCFIRKIWPEYYLIGSVLSASSLTTFYCIFLYTFSKKIKIYPCYNFTLHWKTKHISVHLESNTISLMHNLCPISKINTS